VAEATEMLPRDPEGRLQVVRVATHEAGHVVGARLLGHEVGGATVDPGPGYEGRVWGRTMSRRSPKAAATPRIFGKRLLR
jgi:hypothetical protein